MSCKIQLKWNHLFDGRLTQTCAAVSHLHALNDCRIMCILTEYVCESICVYFHSLNKWVSLSCWVCLVCCLNNCVLLPFFFKHNKFQSEIIPSFSLSWRRAKRIREKWLILSSWVGFSGQSKSDDCYVSRVLLLTSIHSYSQEATRGMRK